MSSRANKPDTQADIRLKDCLISPKKSNFIMIAGAGSGKTTSLIKGLATIITTHGDSLKKKRQRIACITYTEVAAGEIWSDVGNNPLVHVSTIHSFLWAITRSFQSDIREWLAQRIDERIAELQSHAEHFGPRVQERTREKNRQDIARLEDSKAAAIKLEKFTYGTGPDYSKGVLGHDDIIRMATSFILDSALFRSVVAQQFPFIFVDEGQDTQAIVVDALKSIAHQAGPQFSLGFFGDPMQRIFPTGVGQIEVENDWALIEKEENFRCPTAILAVANAIRRGGDDLIQVGGRTEIINGQRRPVEGTARIFILPSNELRNESIASVRNFISRLNSDSSWSAENESEVKLLVIVHRMAATRLGFAELYSAMNDKAPSYFSEGFMDASAWPLHPFGKFVIPIVEAIGSEQEFEAMTILREHCQELSKDALTGKDIPKLLAHLRTASLTLFELMKPGKGTCTRDVLNFLRKTKLLSLDSRLLSHLDQTQPDNAEEEIDEGDYARESAAMEAFFRCPAEQLYYFYNYIKDLSPFSTQQGIKGAEFERVLVILDDEEGTHSQFSYDKYFGVKEPSKRDLENIRDGKETTIDRTRRLFYVCCTRALQDLAVIYFSATPDIAETHIRASGIFETQDIYNEQALH